MCRQPTTTAVRAEHVKLPTVTEAEPLHTHGHGILGSTGGGEYIDGVCNRTKRTELNAISALGGNSFF